MSQIGARDKKVILAVVGLPGSGKTEATKYIIAKTGWPKVYFGQITLDEIKNRGLQVNETNEKAIREELRKNGGMDVFARESLPKIRGYFKNTSVVLESLYSWEEYLVMAKEFGEAFKVLAIYASPQTRTKRLTGRAVRPLSAGEFASRDFAQIENLHQAGPIARADYTIVNESTFANLEAEIDKVLKAINS